MRGADDLAPLLLAFLWVDSGKSSGDGQKVLLPFEIELAKGIDQRIDTLLKSSNPIGGGRNATHVTAFSFGQKTVVEEPYDRNVQEFCQLGEQQR